MVATGDPWPNSIDFHLRPATLGLDQRYAPPSTRKRTKTMGDSNYGNYTKIEKVGEGGRLVGTCNITCIDGVF